VEVYKPTKQQMVIFGIPEDREGRVSTGLRLYHGRTFLTVFVGHKNTNELGEFKAALLVLCPKIE
jgi:hypothetical protein